MKFTLNDKLHILNMVEKHGIITACETCKVGKTSIYNWQKIYEKSWYNKAFLKPKSTRPTKMRQKKFWDYRIRLFIVNIRKRHYFLGKDKIKILLDKQAQKENWNCDLPGISTIGRLLSSMKKNHEIPRQPVPCSYFANTGIIRDRVKKKVLKPRPQKYDKFKVGQRVQIDTVITIKAGVRRYTIQATDVASRYACSHTYKSISSENARLFFLKVQCSLPNITAKTEIQTDNGSEFMGNFKDYLTANNYKQYWNYVHSPKMNCFIERFNRTKQEEFLNGNKGLLFYDLDLYNQEADKYIYWYNHERPHHGLDLLTPAEYVKKVHS
jgi:transposase InsO family protein